MFRWLSNTWDASHMNVQAKVGLDTKIFDWHMDSQPLTLIINVSDMPEKVEGGSTILRRHDDGYPTRAYQTNIFLPTIFSFSQMGPLSLLVFFWQSFMQLVLVSEKICPIQENCLSLILNRLLRYTAGTGFQ